MTFIKRYWRIIFPIFFMIIIWIFSSQDANTSDNVSISWANALGLTNAAARKLAHMTLFAGLACSCASFVKGLHPLTFPTAITASYSIILAFAYGALDEVHQILVPGRTAQITDILIDTLGGIIGTLLYIAIFCFWRRFRLRHKKA